MEYNGFDEKIGRVFSLEIQRIVDEIAWIDKRLLELEGDESDEARVEKILLMSLRSHLISDLRELGGFSGDPYLFGLEPVSVASGESAEEAYSYS
ncbi:MAG: hypothetical protein F7B19_02665 [Desulfurococcales archaeon]|nr:hypothetical protein [Desulfurococcales archaeon]MCE4626440.1 hypothetical protein [Desulfurococcales archaeon]